MRKLSSTLTLRVELKERKLDSEICWFKLCSSKLTITSWTRSDLSVISKRTPSCSFPKHTKVRLAALFPAALYGGCEVRKKIFFTNQHKQSSFLYSQGKRFNIPWVQKTDLKKKPLQCKTIIKIKEKYLAQKHEKSEFSNKFKTAFRNTYEHILYTTVFVISCRFHFC